MPRPRNETGPRRERSVLDQPSGDPSAFEGMDYSPQASRSASTLSVFSQVNSGSSRPK